MSASSFGGLPGEEPIHASNAPATPPTRPTDATPGNVQPTAPNEFIGSVSNVKVPGYGDPTLSFTLRLVDGVVLVKGHFWNQFHFPSVAEGQEVRVIGKQRGNGSIKPSRIENLSTGSKWRRWRG